MIILENVTGKNVVCIVSGSNNDITRTEEIKEQEDYNGLVQRMEENGFIYEYINEKEDLFRLLI